MSNPLSPKPDKDDCKRCDDGSRPLEDPVSSHPVFSRTGALTASQQVVVLSSGDYGGLAVCTMPSIVFPFNPHTTTQEQDESQDGQW